MRRAKSWKFSKRIQIILCYLVIVVNLLKGLLNKNEPVSHQFTTAVLNDLVNIFCAFQKDKSETFAQTFRVPWNDNCVNGGDLINKHLDIGLLNVFTETKEVHTTGHKTFRRAFNNIVSLSWQTIGNAIDFLIIKLFDSLFACLVFFERDNGLAVLFASFLVLN